MFVFKHVSVCMNTDKGREGHGASCPAGRGRRAEEGPCSTVACFYVLTSVLFQHSNIFIGRILLMFYTIILIPKLKGYKTVYGQDFNFQMSKQKPHRDRLIISRKRKKANMTKQNTLNLGGRIQVFIVLVFRLFCIFNIFHNIKMELKTHQIHILGHTQFSCASRFFQMWKQSLWRTQLQLWPKGIGSLSPPFRKASISRSCGQRLEEPADTSVWTDWGGQQVSPQSLWGHSQGQGLLGSSYSSFPLPRKAESPWLTGAFNINYAPTPGAYLNHPLEGKGDHG